MQMLLEISPLALARNPLRRLITSRWQGLPSHSRSRHIRSMPHRIARTFGSRAEPRAVTGESGLPQGGLPDGADRRPPGFGEAPQPLMQEHPLVTGTGAPEFVPHRPHRPHPPRDLFLQGFSW